MNITEEVARPIFEKLERFSEYLVQAMIIRIQGNNLNERVDYLKSIFKDENKLNKIKSINEEDIVKLKLDKDSEIKKYIEEYAEKSSLRAFFLTDEKGEEYFVFHKDDAKEAEKVVSKASRDLINYKEPFDLRMKKAQEKQKENLNKSVNREKNLKQEYPDRMK